MLDKCMSGGYTFREVVKEAQMDRRTPTETIDITPTWRGLLPYFFLALENGNTEGRKIAREELAKMARAADLYNEMVKEAR